MHKNSIGVKNCIGFSLKQKNGVMKNKNNFMFLLPGNCVVVIHACLVESHLDGLFLQIRLN